MNYFCTTFLSRYKVTDFLQGGEYPLYSKCVPIMWDNLDYTLDLNHAHTVLFFFTFDGKK